MNAVDAVNYGAIGVVIGHEISHGFDDEGAQFDFLGRLRNWWTDSDLKDFQSRGACVADQFDHTSSRKTSTTTGNWFSGESIGDLGGAKIAFLAYEKSLEGKPRPADVDGFTPSNNSSLHGDSSRRRDSSGSGSPDGAERSASDCEVPRDRSTVELARISKSVELQGRRTHGPARRKALRRLVASENGAS